MHTWELLSSECRASSLFICSIPRQSPLKCQCHVFKYMDPHTSNSFLSILRKWKVGGRKQRCIYLNLIYGISMQMVLYFTFALPLMHYLDSRCIIQGDAFPSRLNTTAGSISPSLVLLVSSSQLSSTFLTLWGRTSSMTSLTTRSGGPWMCVCVCTRAIAISNGLTSHAHIYEQTNTFIIRAFIHLFLCITCFKIKAVRHKSLLIQAYCRLYYLE